MVNLQPWTASAMIGMVVVTTAAVFLALGARDPSWNISSSTNVVTLVLASETIGDGEH